MKVTNSFEKINPFGGINFVIDEARKCGLPQMIDSFLGVRGKGHTYKYSDIFTSMWSVFFCGGDCAEDINTHFGEHLRSIPGCSIPSADVILNGQKELATFRQFTISKAGKMHDVDINSKMSLLLLRLQKKLGLLKKDLGYTLDFDHQLIPCEKMDTSMSYKKIKGYFPGICIINGMPVYIENRSGHTNVKYLQEETLERAFLLFRQEGIKIKRSRMDCGSYSKNIINVVESNCESFYIRAQKCEGMELLIQQINTWERRKIGKKFYQVASVEYFPFGQKDKGYRLVLMKEPNKTGQMDVFTQDAMVYRGILTNDWKTSEKKIIEFYNARGAAERVFDVMNNDFGWNKLPFSRMEENTVYLIMTAMCKSFYKYLVEKLARRQWFLPNIRIKKFIFGFITVASKWTYRSRTKILKIYTPKHYQLAFG
jgi:hypothetical protein